MTAKKCLVYRHVPFEDLGILDPILRAADYDIEYFEVGLADFDIIAPVEADLLVVLGGPIAAYDGSNYPFLDEEIRNIRGRVAYGRPTVGICLGMQIAVIEFARNGAGLADANSLEFDKQTHDPVIYLMKEWYDEKTDTVQIRDETSEKGGTMRLGAYSCNISEDTLAHKAYNALEISERHRHRYEFNNEYKADFIANGMEVSGVSPSGELVEIMELKGHPWFLGCQFHPEFKSRPMNPQPLFKDFIAASLRSKMAEK